MDKSHVYCVNCNAAQAKDSKYCSNCAHDLSKPFPGLELDLEEHISPTKRFIRTYGALIAGVILGAVIISVLTSFYVQYIRDIQKVSEGLATLNAKLDKVEKKIDSMPNAPEIDNSEILDKIKKVEDKIDDSDDSLKEIKNDVRSIKSDVSIIQLKIGY